MFPQRVGCWLWSEGAVEEPWRSSDLLEVALSSDGLQDTSFPCVSNWSRSPKRLFVSLCSTTGHCSNTLFKFSLWSWKENEYPRIPWGVFFVTAAKWFIHTRSLVNWNVSQDFKGVTKCFDKVGWVRLIEKSHLERGYFLSTHFGWKPYMKIDSKLEKLQRKREKHYCM